jgi:hypothetical protein
MAASDDLFELIKKLDQSERQRIRRFAMLARDDGSPPHYLKLFEDLSKLKQYDEKLFREAHGEEGYAASYPQNKVYLYNLILEALRGQRKHAKAEKPKDFQIRERIEEVHLLKQKMLFDQSLRRLEKARKEAERYQYFELLLEILKALRTHINEHPDKDYIKNLREILEQIDWVGEQIRINCQLLRLRDEFFLAARSGVVDATEPGSWTDATSQIMVLKAQLEKDSPWPASVEARTNVHLSLALQRQIVGDLDGAWENHRAVYVIWRDLDDFRDVRRIQYHKIIYNYLAISIAARKRADFIEALEFLEKGPFHSPDERADSKQNAVYIRLQYFLSHGEWEDAISIEVEFRKMPEWVTEKMQRPRLLAFYMSFARLHVILDSPKAAKSYLSYFDEEHQEGIHDDKWAEAKVLEVLIQFGTQDHDTLESRIRSARRYVAKMEKAPAYFGVFLGSLNAMLNIPGEERKQEWEKLLAKITAVAGPLPYDSGFHLLQAWIMSQRHGVKIREILK